MIETNPAIRWLDSGDVVDSEDVRPAKSLLAYLDEDALDRQLSFPLAALTARTTTSRDEPYAELRAIRAIGLSEDRRQAAQGLFCFAVGVPATARAVPIDAISVSVPSFRLSHDAHAHPRAPKQGR